MTPFADVPQIVIDGAALIAAAAAVGTAIGGGVRYGFKAAAAVVVTYLTERDKSEAQQTAAAAGREDAMRTVLADTTVALTELKGAVTEQGKALASVVLENRDHRHDLNGLAHVLGLRAELERVRAERHAQAAAGGPT